MTKWLNPFEAKNIGQGLWEINLPTTEAFKKHCHFSFDNKKAVWTKKTAGIEVHYSCFSMKDKFQKIHEFDLDLAQYLNNKKQGNGKIVHSQDDLVLKCDSGSAKGLVVMLDLEIGSPDELDDRIRSSIVTEDEFGEDGFEELDFDLPRKQG